MQVGLDRNRINLKIGGEEPGKQFINKYFVLNNAILRTVSEDETVVAYFVTSINEHKNIPVDFYESEASILGKATYAAVSSVTASPKVDSSAEMNGRYNYYSEMYGTGRYGMYNEILASVAGTILAIFMFIVGKGV